MYLLSEEADLDFLDAFDYIAEHSPAAADRWAANMMRAFSHLTAWPYSGHIRRGIAPETLRFWSEDQYIVVYDPQASPLLIVAVLHGSQDIPALLAIRLRQDTP